MAFKRFNEYLDEKGNIPKVKVKDVAGDVDGSKQRYTAPPESEDSFVTDDEGGKVSKKKKSNKHKNYVSKGKMSENWDKENPELKYEPKTKFEKETDKFLNKTKDMDVFEFSKYVSDQYLINDNVENIPAISTPHGDYIPAPHELFRTTSYMIMVNEKFMESFVRELKRKDGITNLVSELANHRELYEELVELLAENENFSKRLVRSIKLNEMVGSPMHKNIPDDLDGDEDEKKEPNMHDELEDDEEAENDMDMGDDEDEDDDDDFDMHDDEGDEDEDDLDMHDDEEGMDMHKGPMMHHDKPHRPMHPALNNLKKAMGMN